MCCFITYFDETNFHIDLLYLTDILSSEHEEAIFAATEALKGLMSSCIDEGLVTKGVQQIKLNAGGIRKSGPTIIERICSTMESLLGYKYNAVWDMSFQVLSAAFYQLGTFSIYFSMLSLILHLDQFIALPDRILTILYKKNQHFSGKVMCIFHMP